MEKVAERTVEDISSRKRLVFQSMTTLVEARQNMVSQMRETQLDMNETLNSMGSEIVKFEKNIPQFIALATISGKGRLCYHLDELKKIIEENKDILSKPAPAIRNGQLDEAASEYFVAALSVKHKIEDFSAAIEEGLRAPGSKENVLLKMADLKKVLDEKVSSIQTGYNFIKEEKETLKSITEQYKYLRDEFDSLSSVKKAVEQEEKKTYSISI